MIFILKNSNKYLLDKYGKISYEIDDLIDKKFINKNYEPIKCKSCGGEEILEIEEVWSKTIPFNDFWKDGFTGEITFVVNYRCCNCMSLEGTEFNGKNKVFF